MQYDYKAVGFVSLVENDFAVTIETYHLLWLDALKYLGRNVPEKWQ